jgi:hypothetical protein
MASASTYSALTSVWVLLPFSYMMTLGSFRNKGQLIREAGHDVITLRALLGDYSIEEPVDTRINTTYVRKRVRTGHIANRLFSTDGALRRLIG